MSHSLSAFWAKDSAAKRQKTKNQTNKQNTTQIQQQFALVLEKIKTVKIELLKSRHSVKSYTIEASSFLHFTLFKFARELWGKQSIDENKTLAMINT